MRFHLFQQSAIAATRPISYIHLFGAFLMQVATTLPQTARVLLAVGQDKAKVFAVVALSKTSLISV
jgi:hypothetical protein